jgi:fatty acid desaturase
VAEAPKKKTPDNSGRGPQPYELPRLARPVAWWEVLIVVVAWGLLLSTGWLIAHQLALPLFWSTVASVVLGSAAVGQLVIERWAGHVDGHLDTERRRKKVGRRAEARRTVQDAKKRNTRLREGLTTTVFWFAVATTVALGATVAGEAAEVGLTCYGPNEPMSHVLPKWQADAVCK